MAAYMRDQFPFLGVKAPARRASGYQSPGGEVGSTIDPKKRPFR